MVKNRKCLSCQTGYSYCPNCSGSDRFAPAWKAEFCSESCKDLWLTATRFNMSILSKEEAKSIISELDLKPIDKYVECVQRDYKKIMAEAPKKRGRRIEMKPIDDAMNIEPTIVEQVINQIVDESHEVVLKENE